MIRIAILGSTGSIGRSALEVVARHRDQFEIVGLAANSNFNLLTAQVARFEPKAAVLRDESVALPDSSARTEWRSGRTALLELAARSDVDVVVNALVGSAGLEPTLAALGAGHRLALANKESLVAGGSLVLDAARRGGGEIVPIDSEHSAISQCIQGHSSEAVRRVILTASGGPFRGCNSAELALVGADAALQHPTWDMGGKITIDSATLANKALEVIEAHFLYGLAYEAIEAVVHPQSVIHSFVEFIDGSVLAQLGVPTMELPILYALSYPDRVNDQVLQTYDPVQSSPLTFEEIDHDVFPMFALGVEAGRRSGCSPTVYNAGNEVAVQAFLEGRVGFLEITDIVEEGMDRVGTHELRDIDDVIAADEAARAVASEVATKFERSRMGMNT